MARTKVEFVEQSWDLGNGVSITFRFRSDRRPFIAINGTSCVVDSSGEDTRKPEPPAVAAASVSPAISPDYNTPEIAEARRVLEARYAQPEKAMTPSVPPGFNIDALLANAPPVEGDEDAM